MPEVKKLTLEIDGARINLTPVKFIRVLVAGYKQLNHKQKKRFLDRIM